MLHYRDRHDKVHILTMDPVLLEDIRERLEGYPGMGSVELVTPGTDRSVITSQDVLRLARDTTTSKVVILDVRTQTRAQLQRAYSDIARFNRPDFNHYCYSVLVGDGPVNFFRSGGGLKMFASYLADLRIDFGAGAFFGDPFLYYTMEEMQQMAIYAHNALPERVSRHLERYFGGDRPSVAHVRRYFRAADKNNGEKLREKEERQEVLRHLCIKMVVDEFPDDREQVLKALSKEGLAFAGERLRCNVYPFHFEELVFHFVRKAQTAI